MSTQLLPVSLAVMPTLMLMPANDGASGRGRSRRADGVAVMVASTSPVGHAALLAAHLDPGARAEAVHLVVRDGDGAAVVPPLSTLMP